MVRELNMDTQRQNFWKESIHKEAHVRLGWHIRYSREFAGDNLLPQRKNKSLVPKRTINIDSLNKTAPVAELKNKKKQRPATTKDITTNLVEMRPVSAKTKDLLYKGFSALGEGRHAYLTKRKEKRPELKYEFPITSTWEYGWKITDAMRNSSLKPATHGRTRIVHDTFYTRNGVLPFDRVQNAAFV